MVNEDLFFAHKRVNLCVFTDLELSLLMPWDVILIMRPVLCIEIFCNS